jgi:uncharacterized protein
MDLELSVATYLLLFFAGLAGGFIDSIAGGGGLISVPALLWAGLPPQIVLGTNKMQAVWGTLIAVRGYAKKGWVRWREMKLVIGVTFVGALLGTWVVTLMSNELLLRLVPWLLFGIALYVLFSPRFGQQQVKAKLSPSAFALLMGSLLGFYDGFFGPGTGSFWTVACLGLLGLDLLRATAYTKVVNLASNAASVLVFACAASIRYDVAVVMVAGQLGGAWLGSRLAIRHGVPFIRMCFLSVVLALVIKLLWDQLVG